MNIILAIILGTAFGFALHRVGASNPQNIINMLRLRDFHLMKVILFAIAIASSILFIGLSIGIINPVHLSVKTAYWGVIIGGLIFGVGWAIGSYCPGTGVAAIGEGRRDAMFFVIGGLVGAFFYTVIHSKLDGTFFLDKILGGNVTLALTPNESYKAILGGSPGVIVALIVAIILGVIAWRLPPKTR
jgi:uncharacterized membrane protein YedE/YeeE